MHNFIKLLPSFLEQSDLIFSLDLAKSRLSKVHETWTNNSETLSNDPDLFYLLDKYKSRIERIVNKQLVSKYTFYRFSTHTKKNNLPSHIDRLVCEFTISINLSYTGSRTWPLFIKDFNNKVVQANLEPGDAVLYSGSYLQHWRDELEEGDNHQLCFHYADKNGLFKDFAWNAKC